MTARTTTPDSGGDAAAEQAAGAELQLVDPRELLVDSNIRDAK